MDDFKYTIAMKNIDALKTLKAREKMIREYVTGIHVLRYKSDTSSMSKTALLLKLVTRLIKGWNSARKLTEFIYGAVRTAQKKITKEYIKSNVPYEKYIDTFQYCDMVTLSYPSLSEIKKLAITFMGNPIPFKFSYTIRSSAHTIHLYNNIPSTIIARKHRGCEVSAGLAVELEALKLELEHTGIKYTVLEDLLDIMYTIIAEDRTEEFIEKARYRIDMLKKANDVMLSKLQA